MENNGVFCDRKGGIHFVGIGGVGMYSLARLAMGLGISVSGSDLSENGYTRSLASLGARIFYTHSEKNITEGVRELVYSLAIAQDNPELTAAAKMGIPVRTRAEKLGELMRSYAFPIGVSGSHGKSTTTAMIYHILAKLGKNPTALIGAPLRGGVPFADGGKDILVYEACEYKDSFLKFFPSVVAITNIELDHTDYFSSLNDIKHSFLMCINRAERLAVINIDDENSSSLLPLIDVDTLTYGFSEKADVRASLSSFRNEKIKYKLIHKNSCLGEYSLRVPGVFNISNALCAICAASSLGIPLSDCAQALADFSGIGRRMELVGNVGTKAVIYDYAHHPTEIRAVIDALKLTYRTLTVIFKPHTYTRTRDMWDEFASALSLADSVIITDIFPAREEPIEGVSSQRLAAHIGESAVYATDLDAPLIALSGQSRAIVVMGAGNNDKVLAGLLEKRLDNLAEK